MSDESIEIIQKLRCFQCNAFAYTDCFKGEYGESGYICVGCVKEMTNKVSSFYRDHNGSKATQAE